MDTEAMALWVPAYIGVGSNLDDPAAQVAGAMEALRDVRDTRLVAVSPSYGNPPMGPQDQPDYVNAVAGVLTRLSPDDLLTELQKLEVSLGRVRTPGDKWGPRIIDLDLLAYGIQQRATERLTLPHPGISERNFVLFPLCDIAPMLVLPGQGSVARMAALASREGLQAL